MNNFSKFEQEIFSTIIETNNANSVPITNDIHLFAQICLDGAQNANFGAIIGLDDSIE